MTLQEIARALGGNVSGNEVLAPGPGHGLRNRNLSVKLSHQSPHGFIVHSFAADDWRLCQAYVAAKLGITLNRSAPRPTAERTAQPPKPDLSAQGRVARAVALWGEGADPRGTVVEHYLSSRELNLPDEIAVQALRFHPTCPWMDSTTNTLVRVPAMLVAMRSLMTDQVTAVHRTRLTQDGVKVDRRMLGVAAGAAVKLDADDTVTAGLTIGEGVETCLAGRQLGFRPVWALASAGAISVFPVLGGVEALTILTEADEASARATNECGSRWHAARREVVLVAPRSGSDMNDAIREAA